MTATRRPAVDLFLVSFLILFLELACIRWFGSTVVFLTFFTNVVLLASFLGMSVGCLAASSRRSMIEMVIPLLLVAMACASAVLLIYSSIGRVMIDVGGQGSPQQIYFGTEYRARDVSRFVVPLEAVAGFFFTAIALTFVGLGQVMGRAFNATPNRVAAYTWNIAGSLAGIAAFAAASYLRTPPDIWFGIALALCLYFVPRWTPVQVYGQIAALLLLAITAHAGAAETIWSPYYKITYHPGQHEIETNNIGHQMMVPVETVAPAYHLPHLLNRDAGGQPFRDVLVIGAGSGNDVATALNHGAEHVDAVEIDPAIYDLGRRDHPDHPYDDPRVEVHIDDGRSFVRRTTRKYDLVVYALVDSLVLHSGFSNIRLESFLFTKEAFRDIRSVLKPGGLFVAYNYYRQGWVIGRLSRMMTETFAATPLVLSMPYRAEFAPDTPVAEIAFLLDGDASTVSRIGSRFAPASFWINSTPAESDRANGFANQPPSPARAWLKVAPAKVIERPGDREPTDDWPFVYLRDRVVPTLNIRGAAVIGVLSIAIIMAFSPERRIRPNWRMFFMGAGFMLLETKGVVHLALLFGSTWLVNSIVFFAILVMILLSNLWVLMVKPVRLEPYYALLGASLILGVLVPMSAFLTLPGAARVIVSSAVVFVPVFFAGVVFGTAFRDSSSPDVDFGSNIAGAVVGGLSETLSLLVGFNNLLLLALVFYACSAMSGRRSVGAPIAPS